MAESKSGSCTGPFHIGRPRTATWKAFDEGGRLPARRAQDELAAQRVGDLPEAAAGIVLAHRHAAVGLDEAAHAQVQVVEGLARRFLGVVGARRHADDGAGPERDGAADDGGDAAALGIAADLPVLVAVPAEARHGTGQGADAEQFGHAAEVAGRNAAAHRQSADLPREKSMPVRLRPIPRPDAAA